MHDRINATECVQSLIEQAGDFAVHRNIGSDGPDGGTNSLDVGNGLIRDLFVPCVAKHSGKSVCRQSPDHLPADSAGCTRYDRYSGCSDHRRSPALHAGTRVACREIVGIDPARGYNRILVDGASACSRVEACNALKAWLCREASPPTPAIATPSITVTLTPYNSSNPAIVEPSFIGQCGGVLTPRKWVSLYASYLEGLTTINGTPTNVSNFGQQLPPTASTQREAGIKVKPLASLLPASVKFSVAATF